MTMSLTSSRQSRQAIGGALPVAYGGSNTMTWECCCCQVILFDCASIASCARVGFVVIDLKGSRSMKRFMPPLLAVTAAIALLGSAADAQGPVTPLSEEPESLHVQGNQAITDHVSIPATCTLLVDRVGGKSCLEVVTDWICPAGPLGLNPLSEDAKQRLAPSYEESIANPVSERAYLDSHCLLVGTRPVPLATPAAADAAVEAPVVSFTG